MPAWPYRKGVHDLGTGCYAYLQPDGTWGWSNAGLVADQGETLLVDTLFDLKCTRDMLAALRGAVPAAARIGTLVNTHSNGDHTFGNQLVPGAQIIASRACAAEMKERTPAELAGMMRNWRCSACVSAARKSASSRSGRRIPAATSSSTCPPTRRSSPATSCSSTAIR